MKIGLLIPVYNEAGKLKGLLEQTEAFISAEDTIVVDDGSTDGSGDGLEGRYSLIHHQTNLGKGRALASGFEAFVRNEYEYIITMDADGQHRPEAIPAFIAKAISDNCDIIIGNRLGNFQQMPWDRKFSNGVTSLFLSLLAGQRIYDAQCGFRMYKADFLRGLKLTTSGFDTENEILLIAIKRRLKIGWVEIPTVYADEISHINRLKDTGKYIILMIKYLTGRIK